MFQTLELFIMYIRAFLQAKKLSLSKLQPRNFSAGFNSGLNVSCFRSLKSFSQCFATTKHYAALLNSSILSLKSALNEFSLTLTLHFTTKQYFPGHKDAIKGSFTMKPSLLYYFAIFCETLEWKFEAFSDTSSKSKNVNKGYS